MGIGVKTPTKAEKKAIMDRHGSVSTADAFTDEQWSRLMWAGHSEVNDIYREVSVEKGFIALQRKLEFKEWCKENEQQLVEYVNNLPESVVEFNVLEYEKRMYEEYLNVK